MRHWGCRCPLLMAAAVPYRWRGEKVGPTQVDRPECDLATCTRKAHLPAEVLEGLPLHSGDTEHHRGAQERGVGCWERPDPKQLCAHRVHFLGLLPVPQYSLCTSVNHLMCLRWFRAVHMQTHIRREEEAEIRRMGKLSQCQASLLAVER